MPNPNVGILGGGALGALGQPINARVTFYAAGTNQLAPLSDERARQLAMMNSATLNSFAVPRTCRCAYCASVLKGDRCDSCGAPR